jgi:PAS domain S-box-containing protein
MEATPMASELRNTGISVLGDVPWGTHFCYFYETKQDLLDILVPYFKAGLEGKEFCLWIISNSELITTEEAKVALGQAVPDLDRYLAEGRIQLVSHDQWFLKGGAFDFHKVANGFKEKLDEALARGYAGMRVNGSPAWIQTEDTQELREFEQEVNHLFPNERIIASCTYPLGENRADFLLDVARNHQFVIARRQGNWEVLETPELIQAKQEIKKLNEELEQRVIERTRELAAANEELRREIAGRKRVEEALRRSEDRIRLVIDTIPIMAWTVQPDGTVDFLNQRWLDYSGLSFEQYIDEPTGPIHPEDIPRVLEKWLVDMAAGEPYEDEMRLRRADGEYRWFMVRTEPLRDESGKIVKWYGVSSDIDDRKRAEEELKATTEQLRALSARLQSAREEESKRIAREIHDELGGALTSWKWDLEEIRDVLSEPADSSRVAALRTKIEGMIKLTETTVDTVRRLASELRPMALELGLVEAIEWQALQFKNRTGIAVQLECSLEKVDLNNEQSTAVFRILQEALTNIQRHAQPTKVTITMKEESGQLFLTIEDNGRGITKSEELSGQSLGLLGMRERAHLVGGQISIESAEGQGTRITLEVPISAGERLGSVVQSNEVQGLETSSDEENPVN